MENKMSSEKENVLWVGDLCHTGESIQTEIDGEQAELQPLEDLMYCGTWSEEGEDICAKFDEQIHKLCTHVFVHLSTCRRVTVSNLNGIKKGPTPKLFGAIKLYWKRAREEAEEMDRKGIPRLY